MTAIRHPLLDEEERFDVTLPDGSPATMTAAEIEDAAREALKAAMHFIGMQSGVRELLDDSLAALPLPGPPPCADWCSRADHKKRTSWDTDPDDPTEAVFKWCEFDVYSANPNQVGVSVAVELTSRAERGREVEVGVSLVRLDSETYAPSQARRIARALKDAADIAEGKPIPANLRPRFGGHPIGRLA